MAQILLFFVCFVVFFADVREHTISYDYHGGKLQFTVYYETDLKTPKYVNNIYSCEMAKEAIDHKSPNRPSFIQDPRLDSHEQAHDNDYLYSGWSRGHLVTAKYFSFDLEAYKNTYFLTNIAPQNQNANQRWWSKDEEVVLNWGGHNPNCVDDYLIVTGVHGNEGTIGDNKVVIPTYFLNAVCEPHTGNSVCFWEENHEDAAVYYTDVSDCERKCGYNFFGEMSVQYRNCMQQKHSFDGEFWGLTNGNFSFPLEYARIFNSTRL